MMGYELHRFKQIPNKEVVTCSLCGNVLANPFQRCDPACQHFFCKACILVELRNAHPKCPLDKVKMTRDGFQNPPRLLAKLLSELRISCENKEFGCDDVFALSSIEIHQSACPYHPQKEIVCRRQCGLKFTRKAYQDHDCFMELKTEILAREETLKQKEKQIEEMKAKNKEKRQKLVALTKTFVKSVGRLDRVLNPKTRDTS